MIAALPNPASLVKMRKIAEKYGFITFPQFLDNFYVSRGTRGYDLFKKTLEKHEKEVRYAVAPDCDYELMESLKEEYPHTEWIFPLHKKEELEIAKELEFEWVGMPHRRHWRDYSVKWLTKNADGFKLWYLGFWAERRPQILLLFSGFDTTIPETYAGRFGEIWISWRKAVKPKKQIKTAEIFEVNTANLRKAVDELIKNKITRLNIKTKKEGEP